MCYIPPGFWPRLTARLLIFPKRILQVFNQHQVIHTTSHSLSTLQFTLQSCFNNNPITQCWSRGVYSVWIDQAYFLVEQLDDQVFDITLPNTNWGTRYVTSVTIALLQWVMMLTSLCSLWLCSNIILYNTVYISS